MSKKGKTLRMNLLETSKRDISAALVLVLGISIAVSIFPDAWMTRAADRTALHGEELYELNCQSCHRQSGSNPLKPEKRLAESSKLVTLASFRDFLSKKHGVMPSFKGLSSSDRDLKDLYAYVRTLKNQSWEYPQKEPQPQEAPMKDAPPAGASQ